MNPYLPPSKSSHKSELSDSQGKSSPLREALAAGFMVFGVVALVYTLFPWINPSQYKMNTTGNESLLIRTFVGGGLTVALLWAAFYFNRQSKSFMPPK